MRAFLKLRHAQRALTRVMTLGKMFYPSFPQVAGEATMDIDWAKTTGCANG